MTPVQLTPEILDRWLAAVEREMGKPTGYAAPGPSAEAVQAVFGPRPVPPELLTLWTWRTIPYRAPEVGVAVSPCSPAESLEITEQILEIYEREVRLYGPGGWSENYVFLSQVDRIWLVVDFSELGPTSPVYAGADANLTETPGRVADSLGELFEHWTALIETGLDFYDGYWTYRDDYHPTYPINGSPRQPDTE